MSDSAPTSTVDLFDDATLEDPYPAYAALRALGPAVYLEGHQAWAIPRYAEIRDALRRWETYSSAHGVALNEPMNAALAGTVLASDPPVHRQLRSVLSEALAPRGLRRLRENIEAQATQLVDALVERGEFDAVADLARTFPLAVVADLIGVPAEVRHELPAWADASFSAFGPPNRRTEDSRPVREHMLAWLRSVRAEDLAPASMGRAIFEAAEAGRIEPESCAPLLSAYTTAGIDTTVNALSHAVLCFARHPEQWDLVRAGGPTAFDDAFNEVLRHDSPVQAFTRVVTEDTTLGESGEQVTIPAGDRVVLVYGSGNHDDRKYENPDLFDVRRRSADHLSFGFGIHACAGQGLARIEAAAILSALAQRVKRFHTGAPTRHLNNVVRGLESLPVTHIDVV